jgi:Flp pilus assembly protein TadD
MMVSLIVGFASVGVLLAVVDPTQAAAEHVDRSITCYRHGDLRGSIRELRKALKISPTDAQVHFMLGNALYRIGDMRTAAREYKSSLRLRPESFEAHMSRGFALFELGEVAEAVTDWRAASRLEPNEAFARAALAVGLYSLGEIQDAETERARAEALNERYSRPEALRVDIRWSPRALNILRRLRSVSLDGLILQDGKLESLGPPQR